MSLRAFLKELEESGNLSKIKKEVDPHLEIARILANEEKEEKGKAVLFENVKNHPKYLVVGNLLNSRENFARALGIKKGEGQLLRKISHAIKNPSKAEIVDKAFCQEVVEKEVNLNELPILTHTSKDMGPYITSGVFIANDLKYGLNASFHRASPISKDKLVIRLCERDLHEYLNRNNGELDVAICIGLHPSILLAAAISLSIESNELEIANSLHPLKLVKCKTSRIYVPANSEIVLEGKITNKEKHEEGPFVDITGTFDVIREEPIIEINCITHRKNPIYQALLPSFQEHRLLMGMPKEPVIYNEINKVCKCEDVLLTPGGCNWLHGIIKIDKKDKEDGKKALLAAINAHKSLKHVVVVDNDIDIHNSQEVEWAIATRFQGDKDIITKKEKGSSLDPSSKGDRTTFKIGIDATIPWDKNKEKFMKGTIGE
jgi:UbiD family decarboxylase